MGTRLLARAVELKPLKGSADRKTAGVVRWQEKKGWVPTFSNALGLTQVASCPGRTASCESACYVHGSSRYDAVGALLAHNFEQLQIADWGEKVALLSELLAKFVRDVTRWERKAGDIGADMWLYRIHWSGDFFDEEYVAAWVEVMAMFPQIRFWTYTRSVFALGPLAKVPNLTLYASIDSDSSPEFLAEVDRLGVQRAYMGTDVAGAADALVCPSVRLGKLVKVTSRRARGYCAACRYCIDPNGGNVTFPIH